MDSGFPLLEALRQRRAFPVAEVLVLAQKLPALLDGADHQELAQEFSLLQELWVDLNAPPGAKEQVKLPRKPVFEWPAFNLRFRPKTRDLARDREVTNGTIFFRPSTRPASVPARLAELLYELLGGHHRTGGREGFHPPLAALSAEGNAVLLRGLRGGAFASCESFWREWSLACGPQVSSATVPDRFLGQAEPGDEVTLTPDDPLLARIKLVARRQFHIGRSTTQADWVSRFLPLTPKNRALTEQLSRVHLVAERIGQEIGLRDGNGRKASANGSSWNRQELSATAPLLIEEAGVIGIGPFYTVEVIPSWAVRTALIANLDAWAAAAGLPTPAAAAARDASAHSPPQNTQNPIIGGKECQALIFSQTSKQIPVRDALWIFSRVGFDVAEDGAILWNQGGKTAAAASLVYEQGCFWLSRESGSSLEFAVDDVALRPMEIAPLLSGQRWKIGAATYQVSVNVDPLEAADDEEG